MKLKLMILIIIFILGQPCVINAENDFVRLQEVRIGAFNYYPAIFKDQDGEIKGFIVDILKNISLKENWKLKFVYGSWNEGLERIKRNELDLLTSVAYTNERTKFLDYSNNEILTVWSEIYVLEESSINGILSLSDKKIGIMKGDYNGASFLALLRSFKISAEIIEYDSFETICIMLKNNIIDAGVINNVYGSAKQKQFGIVSTGIVFNPFKIFFASGKEKNKSLLHILDAYLSQWEKKENSPYHKAIHKWTHKDANIVKTIPDWLNTFIIGLIALVLLSISFGYITRRQVSKAVLHIKNSEEKLSKIVNSSLDAIIMINQLGEIEYWNPSAETIFGYSKNEVLKKKVHDILMPKEYEATQKEGWRKFESSGEGILIDKVVEIKAIKKDGSKIDIDLALTKVIIDEKNWTLANIRDVTKRKKEEIELNNYRQRLEELVKDRTEQIEKVNYQLLEEIRLKDEAEKQLSDSLEREKEYSNLKSRFISTASHEFRTPLTAIITSSQLIQRNGSKWTKSKIDDHFERIQNSAYYLTKLLDDLTLVNKAQLGKSVFNPVLVDLVKLCNIVINDFQLTNDEDKILSFVYEADKNIFLLDPRQIELILHNLLSNAFKYSCEGGIIELKIFNTLEKLVIEVKDSGIGIPEEDLSKLFEAFHRAKNAELIKGTGLGLSIVKYAVDLHNGLIEVESKLNVGSKFVISLPI